MNGTPPGGHAINQTLTTLERQLAAVRTFHGITRQGVSHGSIRVPDMILVKLDVYQMFAAFFFFYLCYKAAFERLHL
jgi:hypothetical protein